MIFKGIVHPKVNSVIINLGLQFQPKCDSDLALFSAMSAFKAILTKAEILKLS